jgi:hypothetical protein
VRVSIMKGDRALMREYPVQENVIPGAERRYETVLGEPLGAGEYVAQADVWMGFRHTVRRWRFRLTGTNRLPTPELKIAKLAMAEPVPGEASKARVAVANRGDAAAGAQLRVVVTGAGRTLEQKIVNAGTLDGGDERSLTVPVSALPEGAYDLRVELLAKDGRADVRATSFTVRGQAGLWTRTVGWLAEHVLAVVGGMLLLVLAAFAAVGVRLRRRRPAPAPAAPPTDEIAELRAALERIEQQRSDRAA